MKESTNPILATFASCLVAVGAGATEIDQIQELASSGFILRSDQNMLGQVVTVGISGILQSVDVGVYHRQDVEEGEFTLRILANPGGSVLYSRTVAITSTPSTPAAGIFPTPFTNFDLSDANLFFTAGDTFALTLSNPVFYTPAPSGGCYPICWNFQVNDPYPGGDGFFNGGPIPQKDFTFRTYVLPVVDQLDYDNDGIVDACDNCIAVSNPDQRDTNGDGFGNACDPDLNDDGIVSAIDIGLLRLEFFGADDNADFNGDGRVDSIDLDVLRAFFFLPPGPSGVVR